MHVHAQPVAGAVHVEAVVGALRNHVLRVADLVRVQQPQIQQTLRQHGHGGLVRIVEARSGAGGSNGGLL